MSILVVALAATSLGSAAATVEAATGSSNEILIVTVGGVVVSAVTAVGAVLSARKQHAAPAVRYVDPPTSNSLPNELAELYREEFDRLQERLTAQEHMTELWRQRALDAGWTA